MKLTSCHPLGTSNFKVACSFLENLWNGDILNMLVKVVCSESCKPLHHCLHAEGVMTLNAIVLRLLL